MTNRILFSATARVSLVDSGSRKRAYAVELFQYNGEITTIYSRNVAVPKKGTQSPADIAEAVFEDFLNSGNYKRLPEQERVSLAEFLAERTKNPNTRRLITSQGRDLGDDVEIEFKLMQRDTSDRLKIYF